MLEKLWLLRGVNHPFVRKCFRNREREKIVKEGRGEMVEDAAEVNPCLPTAKQNPTSLFFLV